MVRRRGDCARKFSDKGREPWGCRFAADVVAEYGMPKLVVAGVSLGVVSAVLAKHDCTVDEIGRRKPTVTELGA